MFTHGIFSSNTRKTLESWNGEHKRQTTSTMFAFAPVSHCQDKQPMAVYCQHCPVGPVLANQWSELFAGFGIGWVTWLDGTLPLLPNVWPSLTLTISLSSVLSAVFSARVSSATAQIRAKGLTCVDNSNTITSEQSWFSRHSKGF